MFILFKVIVKLVFFVGNCVFMFVVVILVSSWVGLRFLVKRMMGIFSDCVSEFLMEICFWKWLLKF